MENTTDNLPSTAAQQSATDQRFLDTIALFAHSDNPEAVELAIAGMEGRNARLKALAGSNHTEK